MRFVTVQMNGEARPYWFSDRLKALKPELTGAPHSSRVLPTV